MTPQEKLKQIEADIKDYCQPNSTTDSDNLLNHLTWSVDRMKKLEGTLEVIKKDLDLIGVTQTEKYFLEIARKALEGES